jgi:MFS family permease
VGATQLIMLGQAWLIFELSGSALQLGVLGAAAALPNILMTLAGGVIADRFDKRRILMCTSLFTMLLALLAWLDLTGQVAVWHVLAIAALFSLTTGLDWPVRVSLYPELVRPLGVHERRRPQLLHLAGDPHGAARRRRPADRRHRHLAGVRARRGRFSS